MESVKTQKMRLTALENVYQDEDGNYMDIEFDPPLHKGPEDTIEFVPGEGNHCVEVIHTVISRHSRSVKFKVVPSHIRTGKKPDKPVKKIPEPGSHKRKKEKDDE